MDSETMKSTFGEIPVSAIIVADRLRETDPAWVEVLAGMIAEIGLQHPVEVIADGDGYRLVAGAHRLAAVKRLDHETIQARLLDADSISDAAALRVREIIENIGRRELSVLDRAVHLAELKAAYEELHPEARHGGDRRSKASENNGKFQVANLATWKFSTEAAHKTGFSERVIRRAVLLHKNLTPSSRQRLQGTALAEHQSELLVLSNLTADEQSGVLDLMLADEPKASRVAEAHDLLCNIKRPAEDPADKAIKQMISIYTLAPAKAKKHFRRWLEDDA